MAGIIKPLFYEPVKHIYKMLKKPEYFNYNLLESKLRKVPRFTDCRAKVHGWNLYIPDSASFLSAYREIFLEKVYAFKFNNPFPKILDLGANIGLSVLFFKSLYPQAKIAAFEADPKIYEYLKKNVYGNGYQDVQLINKAAWHETATLKFSADGADAGYVTLQGDFDLLEVPAIDISEYLDTNQFDFLKMDIEGAEEFVLPACKEHLSSIKFIFVEYHSKVNQRQCLNQIINVLSESGFRVHLYSVMFSPSAFTELKVNSDFDLQVNIFGWR